MSGDPEATGNQGSKAGPDINRPELASLWTAARARMERSGLGFGSSPIVLRDVGPVELEAICGLLGKRRPTGSTIRVKLVEVDAALARTGTSLKQVLEATSGPLIDRAATRRDSEQAQSDLWDTAFSHSAASDDDTRAWLDDVRRTGRLTRLELTDPSATLQQTLDVLAALLDSGIVPGTPLPVAAALLTGDAHALDPDRPLGQLVASALRSRSSVVDAALRDLWRTVGIEADPANSSALVLGLSGTSAIVEAAQAEGQPLRITNRMLDGPGVFLPVDVVHVCENPSVLVAAADALGRRSAPLVCTDGMPATVTQRLLRELTALGARLLVHADFDTGGIGIASMMIARFGATPWRFNSSHYLSALEGPTTELQSRVGATSWDPPMSALINRSGRAVHEEAVLAPLLADLAIS